MATKTPTLITSEVLAGGKPINLTQPKPATAADGLVGSLEAGADAFTKNLAETARTREQEKNSSLKSLSDAVLKNKGLITLTSEEYAGTVDPAEAELKDINQQIIEEQHGLRRSLQALEKNTQGLYGGGLEIERQRITGESLARQADLSVIQLARQGKYDSAKAIADRYVAAKFEQQKNELDALKLTYEDNKDAFTTAESRAFNTMLGDRTRKIEFEQFKEKARFEQSIRQSDPLYRAQLAKAQKDLETTGTVDVHALGNGTPIQGNNAAITALIKGNNIGQGTKTALSAVLGVINSANDLATANQDGKFTGIFPGGAAAGAIAGTLGLRSEKAINNQGYIDAINLKVQQWASGASLTAEQIKQVGRLVPTVNDSDAAVRAKLNNLTNFMLTQTQSTLQSEGVGFVPAKVDLFNDKAASPDDPLGIGVGMRADISAGNPLGI